GKGDDVCLQRLNLEPLFHQVILVNRDPTNQPQFSIDAASPSLLGRSGSSTNLLNSFYLDGSVLNLRDTNGLIATSYVLKSSISFFFENGVWLGQLQNGPAVTNLASAFNASAIAFYNSPWN